MSDFAVTTPWRGVQGKPDTFPPSAHTQAISSLEKSGASPGQVPTWTGKKWAPQDSGVTKLRTESDAGFASFESQLELVANSLTSLVEQTTAIEAKFDAANATFYERLTAMATGTEATVELNQTLAAKLNEIEAGIEKTDKVTVAELSALATSQTKITARLAQSEATYSSITSNYATRVYADGSASAAKAEAITASAGDATAKVYIEAEARAGADGAIHAQWGVKVDGNGRVVGRIKLDASETESTLDFDAGVIRIWNGTDAIAPFELTGGVVRMSEVVVTGEIEIGSGNTQFAVDPDRITFGDTSGYHFNYNFNEDYSNSVAMSLRLDSQPLIAISTGSTDTYPTQQWGNLETFKQEDGSGVIARISITADSIFWGDGSSFDVSLYRSEANVLKTDDTFVSAAEIQVNNGAGESVLLGHGSGYGYVEVGGDSGGFIDLKAPASDDYDLRIIADGDCSIVTAGALDLKLIPGGVVSFGSHDTIGAETVTGFITIKDSGGTTRKLAVVS